MTLLWDADRTAADRYELAIGGVTQVETQALLDRALAGSPAERLVVIGPDIDIDAACTFSESARVDRPDVGVVMLRRRLDVSVLGQALRAGIREVVTADDLTGLAEAARRSRELSTKVSGGVVDTTRAGRVITVFSAKGGVGKTTFSTNIGAYLASIGHKVLIVDLDLAFGDVGISLQMLPQNSILDLVGMAGSVDEQGLAQIVTHHSSGLDAACAPSEPSDADRIPGSTIAELLKVAKRAYDYIVIDTPPSFTEHVLAAFDNSSILVLLATLDIPAVKNLRLTLDTLELLGNPKESRLIVLNRSDAKVGLLAEDVVTAIRQDIAVMVPSSSDVPASVNRGVPIILDEPRHPVSLALKRLIEDHLIIREVEPGAAPAGADAGTQRKKSSGWSLSRGGRR